MRRNEIHHSEGGPNVHPTSAAHDCCNVPEPESDAPATAGGKHKKLILGASLAAALGASLCCILPLVAAVTGLGVFAASAAFEAWRPYLLAITGLLLVGGLIVAYRDYRKACTPGSLCATKPMNRWNLAALGVVTLLVIGLAAFPYYSGTVAEAVVPANGAKQVSDSAALATASFRIPDMDCPACAVGLRNSFLQLDGVADAKVDFASRTAVVSYDPARQNLAAFEKVVRDAGFHMKVEKP
jgi:copper chaperone CopZ